MPEVIFVMSAGQRYPLRELAGVLQYELELQGVPSLLHLGWFPAGGPRCVYILLDPGEYVRLEGEQALPDDGILRRTIFLCTERLPSDADDDQLDLLRRAGAVFGLDQRSILAMHRLGIPARLLRPGYSRYLDHFDPHISRPIDVMFLGTHSLRRTKCIGRAARVLSRHNCLLQISDAGPTPGATSSFIAENRWHLLAKTKVVMNVHRDEETRFEWQRALDAVHAGAVVVTEHSSGIAPFIPGEHLLVASADSLPYVVDAVLEDPERLAQLRARAYERLSRWIPYALWVSVLRAAVVELVGEPLDATRASATQSAGPTSAETRYQEGASATGEPDTGNDPTGLTLGNGRHSEPVPVLVRGGVHVEAVHTSDAWEARSTPRLTVLTTLHGECEGCVATINSLAHSRLRDYELIVIDPESRQGALRMIRDWMIRHPRIPARLLAPNVRQRLGAARNIGLDFARGPCCLTLDPGQALYPRCLDVLVGTLEAMPHVAFVYPIQEVTGAPADFVEAGGDYVLSFWGWDPQRLRQGNYVHGPTLIRTRQLRELGGFTTDEGLGGFEDYDLWCRMAERGWTGQLVPQVLARRAESGSSEVLSEIHPIAGVRTSALIARAPGLMGGAFNARVQPWRRRMKSPRSVR